MTDKSGLEADKKRRRRNRQRTTPIRVKKEIVRLVVKEGHSSKAQIYRELENLKNEDAFPDPLPGKWTVDREVDAILSDFGAGDRSGPWSAGRDAGSPAALAALAAIIERTDGRIDTLSVAEVACIGRLAELVPDLPPIYQWCLARAYVSRENRGDETRDLDALLAYAPWRDDDASERYQRAQRAGRAMPLPYLLRSVFSGLAGDDSYLVDDLTSDGYDQELAERRRQLYRDWDPKRRAFADVMAKPGAEFRGTPMTDDEIRARWPHLLPAADDTPDAPGADDESGGATER